MSVAILRPRGPGLRESLEDDKVRIRSISGTRVSPRTRRTPRPRRPGRTCGRTRPQEVRGTVCPVGCRASTGRSAGRFSAASAPRAVDRKIRVLSPARRSVRRSGLRCRKGRRSAARGPRGSPGGQEGRPRRKKIWCGTVSSRMRSGSRRAGRPASRAGPADR